MVIVEAAVHFGIGLGDALTEGEFEAVLFAFVGVKPKGIYAAGVFCQGGHQIHVTEANAFGHMGFCLQNGRGKEYRVHKQFVFHGV